MSCATIVKYFRDDTIGYCERHNDSLREAFVGYKESGFQFSFLGFSFGWNQKITLYENTLSGWEWPNDKMPFTEQERRRVLDAIALLLSHQGYRVQRKRE